MSIFDFQRLDNILNLLIQKNEPIHINELSSFCGVSDRTIRSDIHTINDYITENGATITLIRKKGYVINYIDKEKFDKFWTNQDSGTFLFTSSDSRLKYLVRKFLTTDNYITQDYLQSILFISQNTLYSDFRTLKNHFSSYNLKLVNKSNLGYIVNGLEQDKRKAIIDLIFKEDFSNYITAKSTIEKDFCNNINYDTFSTIFNKYFKDSIKTDSDYFYRNLFTGIFLAISRIKSNNNIQQFKQNIQLNTTINEIVEKFITDLENQFQIHITIFEKNYFQFLIAENFPNYIDDHTISNNQELAEKITITIYDILSELTNADWLTDCKLKTNLLEHIKLFLSIQTIEGKRSNPILDTIKNNFPYAFELSVACCQEVVKQYNIHFSEDEISYIALHLANAIERNMESNNHELSLAIICGSGKTFSSIIESKIRRLLPNTFSKISKFSYSNFNREQHYHNFDLVISTIPNQTLADNLIYININDLDYSMTKINQFLKTLEKKQNDGNLFSKERFLYFNKKMSKDDILFTLNTILKKQGYVSDDFLNDIYEREKISSTIIGDNIALPHPIGDSVLKSCIFTVINPKGINWDKHQLIKFIFLFAVKSEDTEKIQTIYEQMLDFIGSKDKQDLLLKTPTFETLTNIFSE